MSDLCATLPPAPPHLFIVFGGTGDLMRQKILPALGRLAEQGCLTPRSHVLAVARRAQFDDTAYQAWAHERLAQAGLAVTEEGRHWCRHCLHYFSLGAAEARDFAALAQRIAELEHAYGLPGNRIFYLAIPPQSLGSTVERLAAAGLHHSTGWTRLVVEKPFGHDLASALALDAALKRYFTEEQIYRIDHYLGKEAVQNLLVFRFANSVFEALWNRQHISAVQITVAEKIGAEGRATYYDQAGVLRDMIQNHLLQLLSLVAMEAPVAIEADAVRDEKAKVLRSIREIAPSHVVLGQYTAGAIDGKAVPGYRESPHVALESSTPTFAALRLFIDNWRWQGVPFYLRSGKRLAANVRQITLNFRCPVLAMFSRFPEAKISANALVITLDPEEGFELLFEIKQPGELLHLQTQRLRFRYAEAFARLPEAYETLLSDIFQGDQTLFVRIDEVLEAWRLITPILEAKLPVYPYPAGSWGPPEAEHLAVPIGPACLL